MCFEIYGQGNPLVLIHGGGSTIETSFGRIIPILAKKRQVVAMELQAHGHTNEWDKPSTHVDFAFEELAKDQTYVTITHYGFNNSGDKLIASIKDNTGGFTTVLDGLKAYLEHNIDLNLIADKYPRKVK